MSVTLLKADTFRKVEEVTFAAIKKSRDKQSPIVLIVPDQFTQAVEKSLFKALDIRCSFDIDVMSFARLAQQYKHSNKPSLNQQTSVLLLSKIITANCEKLTCYNKVAGRGKFANQMYAVMTAMRNNNILPSKLVKLADSLEGYLKHKISDIAIVFDLYIKELNDNYTDISSLLDDFRENLSNIESIKSTDFYIFGFHAMTPNKRAIVEGLMQNAKSVTLGLVDISAHENARISPSDIKALEGLAVGHNANVQNYVDDDLTKEQTHCLDKLFGYNITRFSGDSRAYSLLRTRNVEDEIRQAAVAIRSLVMQGYRYRDIAVVCEDFNKYEYLINKIFDSFGISYFIDGKISITTLPQYKFLLAAAAFLRTNCDRDYAMQMLKSGACDVDYCDVCVFENYVYKYNIDRSRLLGAFALGGGEELLIAEKVRKLLIDYIAPLAVACKSGGDMVDAAIKVIGMLKKTPVSRYTLETDTSAVEAIAVAWTRLDDTLSDVAMMLNSSALKGADILELIVDCISSIEFSIAPVKADSVFIGAPQESRFESAKVMFLLGAGAQSYPIMPSDSGIIRDADIDMFYKFGIDMQPNHIERVKQSKFYIAQLLARAKERVYISCPSLYDDVATIASQIKDMFGVCIKECNPNVRYGDSEQEIALKIGTYDNLMSIFCRSFGKGEVGLEELTNFAYCHSDRELIAGLYESVLPTYQANCAAVCFKDNYLKISGLERFFDCPLAYYADNALKLKERPMGKVEINELGTFVHRVLELFYTDNRHPIDDGSILADMVKLLVERVLQEEDFAHFLRQDASGGYACQLTKRCVVIITATNKMLKRSRFAPLHLEYQFGMKGCDLPPISIPLGDQIFKVRGVIDRVDSYGDQIVVIDYKSSEKDFDVSNVFCGHRLQLLVYLQALLDGNNACVGLYYLGLPYKYAKDRDEENIEYNYKGFITNDIEGILSQDSMAESQTFLPLKYVRGKNEIDLTKENVLKPMEFDFLRQYALRLVELAATTIKSGFISPTHTKKACSFCKYAMVCKLKDKLSMQLKDIKTVWEKTNEPTME